METDYVHKTSSLDLSRLAWLPSCALSGVHRLIPHQFVHQIRERTIGFHQLCGWTDKVIRHMLHASEKAVLEHIVRVVHPVDDLDREANHRGLVMRRRSNLRHNNGQIRMRMVHILDLLDRGVAVGPVVVHSEVVGRVAGDFAHEIRDPSVSGAIARARRADELVAFVSKGDDLVVPDVGGLLRRDATALGLVEEVDDAVACPLDGGPVVARELGEVVDHRSEWCTAFELWRCPGIPVTD